MRVLIAVIAAGLSTPALFCVGLYFFGTTEYEIGELLKYFALVSMLSLPIAFLLGPLSYFLLAKIKANYWWCYLFIGAIPGPLVYGLVIYRGPPQDLFSISILSGFGSVSAFVFWLIAVNAKYNDA